MALKEDYLDDILDTSVNEKRKYRMINNADSTISLEDVTEYSQNGDNFGSFDINITNKTVNELIAMGLNVRWNSESDYFEVLLNGNWEQTIVKAGAKEDPNRVYLYNNGVINTEITSLKEWKPAHAGAGTVAVFNSDNIELTAYTQSTISSQAGVVTENAIDLTQYKSITAVLEDFDLTNLPVTTAVNLVGIMLYSSDNVPSWTDVAVSAKTSINKGNTVTLDVSSVNQNLFVYVDLMIDAGNGNHSVKVKQIYLTKKES